METLPQGLYSVAHWLINTNAASDRQVSQEINTTALID
jgi:hypothetical protein